MTGKILVTGGAGFIGSHIVDRLVEKNYKVVVVDNLSSGLRKNVNKKTVFHKLDICSPKIEDLFMKHRFDFIVHEAAQIKVRDSIENPVFDAKVNILGSINLLECARKHGVRKIVYASSGGAVYGEPLYLPADEKHPVNPLSPYGASKHAVEHYLHLYWLNYGLDYISLRYANVYGPRQDPYGEAGVVAIFTGKLLREEKPVVFGDGRQSRDFVYVKDVAEANLLALERKTKNRVFNIGCGVESSVNELALKLRTILNSKVQEVHGEAVKGEVRRIYLNTNLAKKDLKWKPQFSFDEGLRETIKWFRKA